jgi:hypothetical protein
MKRSIAALAVLSALAGCAPTDLSVLILNAHPVNDDCQIDDRAVYVPEGFLDLGPAATLGFQPGYIALFSARSELQPISEEVGGDVIASGTRNDFLVNTAVYSYAADPPMAGLPQNQRVPYYTVIAAGAAQDQSVGGNLITNQAAGIVLANVSAGQVSELLVTFYYEGRIRSSPVGTITRTNQITYPIRVVNSGGARVPTCTAPEVPVITGPCGNSQDSYVVECAAP